MSDTDLQPAAETKTIDRRDLLKTLLATSGAVTAASMLPGQWSKPIIEVGVLPAHAQASRTLTAKIISAGGSIGVAGGRLNLDELHVEVTITPAEAGVEIEDEFIEGPFNGNVGPETTDGDGKALFIYRLCEHVVFTDVTGQGDGCDVPFTLEYTDGILSDTVSGTFDSCSCDF